MFIQAFISRYSSPHKVVFDNKYKFKRYFIPLLKCFSINPVCTMVKMPQVNHLLELVHQVIYNMLVNNNLSNKLFDCVYPLGEII